MKKFFNPLQEKYSSRKCTWAVFDRKRTIVCTSTFNLCEFLRSLDTFVLNEINLSWFVVMRKLIRTLYCIYYYICYVSNVKWLNSWNEQMTCTIHEASKLVFFLTRKWKWNFWFYQFFYKKIILLNYMQILLNNIVWIWICTQFINFLILKKCRYIL